MAMGESESSCLIDSISQFSNIFDKSILVPGPALAYYENLVELLLLLRPVLDRIVNSEIASDGHLTSRTEELDTIINDANKSLECWNPMMSKIHSLLQIDAISLKIEISVGKMCNSLNSLKLAANVTPIQQFLHQLESLREKQASAAVRDVIKNRKEKIPPSAASLALITDILNLSSNQELLMEAVCLDKAKLEAMHENRTGDVELINHLIELVVHMHDSFVKIKQSQLYNGMPIPPDFCCPLSLEPMSDPVIVASGQTYERAFIRNWLDRGLTVCPKTRQTLAHTNLIPNFTVKALIANWCETNHIKLPDPTKSMKLIQPVNPLANGESVVKDVHYLKPAGMKVSDAAKADKKVPLNGKHVDVMMDDKTSRLLESQSASAGPSVSCSTHIVGNGHEERAAKHHASTTYENGHVVCSEQNLATLSPSQPPMQDSVQGLFDEQAGSHNRCSSISSTVSSADGHTEAGDATEVSSDVANDNSDHSGEVSRGSASAASPRDPEFPTRLSDLRSRNHSIWRRGPDRGFVPRITSATSTDTRTNLSEVEAEVRKLVDGLQNSAIAKRESAIALRHLARHNMENRIVIANCGAINLLVDLLHSGDVETQENAVTALLNLSLNDNNKSVIANAGAIEPLIHVLQTGSAEAKENSAATLFSLSVIEENKVRIGRSGAIPPLVDLLGNGTPRGKKDAATALFNLSIFHENKARIVQAGAVRHLVELMDPAAGMVDKAVAVLSNLSTIQEGRAAIGQEGGIPVLVEVVELGSSRGKENAAAALLQLCTNNPKFCHMVLQEGAVPPLVALSQSGTPRAKEKAQQLLSYFRSQRHGNVGRG